ncbi:uncharacterized protein LOC129958294 isoform X4 [Argiope bruennichi]|uniref:uncharacterized protein LOC129958294 isoform X4 n=1 Tax=Argiope bruennichi TaxID=94029 RepID=UPI00249542EC|nr:uncharacterized protein LOC129958294 isoform X4 [Argiope bruennichi]
MVIRDVIDSGQCGITPQGFAKQVAMSTGFLEHVGVVDVHELASVIRSRNESVLIIDGRSFIEHNSCHIATAVNVCCSKIVKRRLQQDKLSVKELLMHTCHCDVDEKLDVVVYDQSSRDVKSLPLESFTIVLLKKLQLTFRSVNLLAGGFDDFHECYPDLCEDKTRKCPPLTSLSQPCLPIANQGPTRILPFLYLGSQFDAMNKELLKDYNITYELNVSTSCPQPEFVPEGHFMRIPVNDTYSEKLLPYFPEAFNFLDKVREGNGCVLVHCLAGISRSATVAIAYVMRYLRLSSDDGYRYVKSKRPTISPNFNFLGQLLEYEKQLRRENILEMKPEVSSAPPLCSKKRVCRTDMRTSKLSLNISPQKDEASNFFLQPKSGDQSPTTALAKLSFDVQKTPGSNEDNPPPMPDFRQFRSKSCYGDWLRDRDEGIISERKTKECNISTTSKVLSPVKEIKCDALISEISTGGADKDLKTATSIRQRVRSAYGGGDGKHGDPFAQFSVEKYRATFSSATEERFSLQTLSHQSYSSSSKTLEYFKGKEQQKVKVKSSQQQFVEDKSFQGNTDEIKGFENIPKPSSPSGSSFPSEDPDSFHDSGVPISPGWVWPRKRVANFDASVNTESGSPTRDKRKYEPFTDSLCNKMKVRTLWFRECNPLQKDDSALCKSAYQFCDSVDKIGLYRVQSCPGIISHGSSFGTLTNQSKICSTQKWFSNSSYLYSKAQDIISHESCPDVLHLRENPFEMPSHRQKDLRRNVRCIQVS